MSKHGKMSGSKAIKDMNLEKWKDQDDEARHSTISKYLITKYNSDYCEQLIEHMADGNSYETFASKLGSYSSTLRDWEVRYPEWWLAKKIAFEKSLLYWEDILKKATSDQLKSNAAMLIFKLKNAFPMHYADKIEMKHTGNNTVFVIDTGIKRDLPDVVIDATCVEDADLL